MIFSFKVVDMLVVSANLTNTGEGACMCSRHAVLYAGRAVLTWYQIRLSPYGQDVTAVCETSSPKQ